MNIKTFERKLEVVDRVKIIELNKSIIAEVDVKSRLLNKSYILSKKDYPDIENNIFDIQPAANNLYYYLDDYIWNRINKTGFYDHKTLETFYEHIIDPIQAIRLPNFDENKIVRFDYSSYLLYRIDEVNPISLPYKVGYIGGITNDVFDLMSVEEDFRNNPNILWMTIVDIPYYNSDDGTKNKAIEFVAKLPQKLHDNLCNYFRDTIKEKHWTCRVKDCLVWRPWYEEYKINLDVLGLKRHYRGKK